MQEHPINDLKNLYAHINAHRNLLKICISTFLANAGENNFIAWDAMRQSSLDLAERQEMKPGELNVEFGKDVQLETVRILVGVFESLKPK